MPDETPSNLVWSGAAGLKPMPQSLRVVLTFALAALLAIIAIGTPANGVALASVDDSKELLDDVSGANFVGTIGDLEAFNTRAYYASAGWNSSIYVHERLAELGLWVYYQDLDVSGFQVRNVVAVKNGSDPAEPQYLFGAHYDSANKETTNYSQGETLAAPGADDDASGVAAVLEIARVLESATFTNTIKFVAFAAEEAGLNGSRYFAEQEHNAGVVYENTALMDMIGFRAELQNRSMIFSGSSLNTLSSSIISAVDRFDLDLSVQVVTGYEMTFSDHASFWEVGYPSLLMIEQLVNLAAVNPYYHTSADTLSTLSVGQMVVITKAVLGGFLLLESPVKTGGVSATTIMIGIMVVLAVVIAIVYLARIRKVDQ